MAVRINAHTSLEGLSEIVDFWKSHQWHPNADWEFFQIIVKSRSNIQSPCVIEIREDEKLVAIAAGRIESDNLSIKFGYARLLRPSIRQLVLIDGGQMGSWTPAYFSLLTEFLNSYLRKERLDCVLVSQVKVGSPLQAALLAQPRVTAVRDTSLHWQMHLPEKWTDFLQSRSKKHRYWIKRLSNVLDRDFPAQWEMKVYSSVEDVAFFLRSAEKIADTTYHRALGVGIKYNDEGVNRMTLEARRQQLRGYLLFIKNEPRAFWYCTTYGRMLHLCTTGYDSSLRNYELGTVLLMKVFQDHCGTEFNTVDFGLGEAGYKQRFGTDNYSETSYLMFSNAMRARTLSAVSGTTIRMNIFAKRVLDKLKLTQGLKTFWRRKISGGPNPPAAAVASESTPSPDAKDEG